jgi:hypothetical protein
MNDEMGWCAYGQAGFTRWEGDAKASGALDLAFWDLGYVWAGRIYTYTDGFVSADGNKSALHIA